MQNRTLLLLFVLLSFRTPLEANDVTEITFMPTHASTNTLPSSPNFGTFLPGASQPVNRCGGNALATGLRVFTDGALVTGVALRCRDFGVIGATETSTLFDQTRMGETASTSRMLECDSGQAITGVRVRSGLRLDAIGISCHVVSPAFATIVNFVADELFFNGRGSVVNAGATSLVTGMIGGSGGTAAAFDCGSQTPFVRALQTSVPDQIWGLRAICSQVLNKVLDPAPTRTDLTVRTVSQARVVTAGNSDAFRVEVFNLGRRITNPGDTAYVDLIFSDTDLQFTAMPTICTSLGAGRLRCSIPNVANIEEGLSASLGTFFATALRSRPEAPVFVVQASYEIDDSNYGNNTYGFAVTVK